MGDRLEARHVDADLRDDRGGDDVADAGDLGQPVCGGTKGLEAFAHLLVDLVDGLLERVGLSEVQLEQEAVMARDLATQRLHDLLARGLHARGDVPNELLGVGLAGNDRGEDGAAALAHDVGEHRAELEVGVLEDLVDALHVRGALAHELLPCSGQVAQVLDARLRDEARADEAVGEQVRDPHRVVHVGLATGHVLDVARVRQDEVEVAVQHVPDRLPVHARRLHRDVRDRVRGEPFRKGEPFFVVVPKVRAVLLDRAVGHEPAARDHGVAVHIEPRATSMKYFHQSPPIDCGTGVRPTSSESRNRAPGLAAMAQYGVLWGLGST